MQTHIKTAAAIVIGFIIAGAIFFQAYMTYQNTQKVNSVISFLNDQMAKSQKAAQ